MAYDSTTIATCIKNINSDYFLPSLQRPFVWKEKDIELLFDSLMRGYPISSFLLWNVKPSDVDGIDVYKFIDDYEQGYTTNSRANIGDSKVSLVLDGQQRLTSLLIGLKGSFTVKKGKGLIQKYLYLDILKYPNESTEVDEKGFYFKFFAREAVTHTLESNWFKVSTIFLYKSKDSFSGYIHEKELEWQRSLGYSYEQMNTMKNILDRLYDVIWERDNISYYTEYKTSTSRVLDIFLRANNAGEKLSKSDLMMSAITTGWKGENARTEIEGLIKDNGGFGSRKGRNKWLDIQWLMKACLVICDKPIVYKVANFNRNNLDQIRANWSDIKMAVTETVKIINNFGVDNNNITATTALMPIVYYVAHTKLKANSSNTIDKKNIECIRIWLFKAILARSFGAASDGKIIAGRRVIAKSLDISEDFPASELLTEINSHDKIKLNNSQAIVDILNTKYKEKKYCFFALSLLYPELDFNQESYHIDHMFPKSHFTEIRLRAEGIDTALLASMIEQCNSLPNLCLLMDIENQKKGDQPLANWIFNQGTSSYDRHLIPKGVDVRKITCFSEFYQTRYELLSQRLSTILGLDPSEPAKMLVDNVNFNIHSYLISDEHSNFYLGWPSSTKKAFEAVQLAIKLHWKSVDTYVPKRQLQENLVVGARRIDEQAILACKCFGMKLFESGFILKFSHTLTVAIQSEFPWVNKEFYTTLDSTTECLNFAFDDMSGKFQEKRFNHLIESLITYLPEVIEDIGNGRLPFDYEGSACE